MARFIDREREQQSLTEMWNWAGAQFLVLYGRRRTGKTVLLLHFAQDKPCIYWLASQSSAAYLLRGFSQALWRYANPDVPVEESFSFPSWETAFRYAADLARGSRLMLIVDEFPYAVDADPSLPSLLQGAWDQHLKGTQVFLALAGSHVGMMERYVLAYRAPLYGRATAQLHLQPMDFTAARQFVPRYSTPAALTTYAIVGGIPAYLERFDDSQSVETNVRSRVLNPTSMFQIDPLYLLNEALREPRHYFAVLEAIGIGHRTLTEIAQAAGLERTTVPKYLNTLSALGIVERRMPLRPGQPRQHREGNGAPQRGIYLISDPYLRFYFRFIVPHQSDLQRGEVDRVWQVIEQQLPAFMGSTVFEELCRTWVQTRGARGDLPFRPTEVGSYWDRQTQVDVVAVNAAERALLLGEARYTSRPVGSDVLAALNDKAASLTPPGWRAHLALFSRSGFTEELSERADAQGVYLVDLEQVIAP
jgi:AAA+ ATPase superfamily predicted ATPase